MPEKSDVRKGVVSERTSKSIVRKILVSACLPFDRFVCMYLDPPDCQGFVKGRGQCLCSS